MDLRAEWLETDGLGGFATGTIGGPRTRRYHALLVAALAPPTRRHVLVNGFDAFVETAGGRFPLTTQRYAPDVVAPDARATLVSFEGEPWPTWTFRLEDGTTIVHERFMTHDAPVVVLSWRIAKPARRGAAARSSRPGAAAKLVVRPFLSGRDQHALHHENAAFRFDTDARPAKRGESHLAWRPYEPLPAVVAHANGAWRQEPLWYRGFFYEEEQARGFEATEDLASPGELEFDLAALPDHEALLVLGADGPEAAKGGTAALVRKLRAAETKRRRAFASPLARAADAYVVKRGAGATIVAGYPWFADWGRDTFLALRGLCLATGRLDAARSILLEWSGAIADGMVPNRFPDGGEAPEYNSVDASLWYVVAVEELLAASKRSRRRVVLPADEKRLLAAVRSILESYVKGTRHGIRRDDDGLLAAGERGQQLTWMDARADGREVTPRIGKPVEIQALWHEALTFAARALKDGARWRSMAADAHDAFLERFWNEEAGCLYDVVDVGHEAGHVDVRCRPNQILAVGGLARPVLSGPRARKVVDAVESKLWTPLGLRTLAPDDPQYRGRYEGGPSQRDGAYHQGSAWPWLVGPFVDAWVRVRGDTAAARREAQRRFIRPLLESMEQRGVSHLGEVADGDAPQSLKGCPFQAWSLGELLRATSDGKAAARGAG